MGKPSAESWEFWQRSQRALDKLNETMQVMATAISQEDPKLQVPPHIAKDVRQAIARFQANFELLVHAQKKAAS
jgi:hypothetical protein